MLTLSSCLVVVYYLRPHLRGLLIDLCGTVQRADFWAAFSNVVLVLIPCVVAMHFQPAGEGRSAPFQIARQLEWALAGLAASVLILGAVLSRFIPEGPPPPHATGVR
jgi:protein-S-isoprenylcysteine O-methyltransferase Ste14